MTSLTFCQHTTTRVEMIAVRKYKAEPGTKLLTSYQGNRAIVKTVFQWRLLEYTQPDMRWNHSPTVNMTMPEWQWRYWKNTQMDLVKNDSHTIQVTGPEWERKTIKRYSAVLKGKLLTTWQGSKINMKRHPAKSGMTPLTFYQGNRTRMEVKTVRTHPAGPTIKPLTHCQSNRTRVGQWEQTQMDFAWNDIHTVKATKP